MTTIAQIATSLPGYDPQALRADDVTEVDRRVFNLRGGRNDSSVRRAAREPIPGRRRARHHAAPPAVAAA